MAPSYAEMTAKMRERPTFAVAEKVLQQAYKLKLPNRTFIQLFNTPEISQFRGYQNELDEAERRRQTLQKERMEIGTLARGAGAQVVPDLNIAHEMLNQQRQAAMALGQHMNDLAAINRQQLAGMHAEQQSELVRLTAAGQQAANRAMMAEGALADLRDMTLAHRGLISELAARGGHVTNNIDARQTSNLVNQHMVDVTTHNQVMNLMHTHAQMFGAYMHQQQISQQETQRLLYEHLRRQEEDRQRNSIVIHRMPPTAPAIQYPVYGQGPPPPPPGGAGAVAATPIFAPAPTPVPTAASSSVRPPPPPAPPLPGAGAERFSVASPEGRGAFGPAEKQRRARSRVPWSSGGVDPPSLPRAPRRREKTPTPYVPVPAVPAGGPLAQPAVSAASAPLAPPPPLPMRRRCARCRGRCR